jgi:hypothetical protein
LSLRVPRVPRGGGMERAILADPKSGFTARVLTGTPNPKRPENWFGWERKDVESLKRAFAGAYGAYCVTSFSTNGWRRTRGGFHCSDLTHP